MRKRASSEKNMSYKVTHTHNNYSLLVKHYIFPLKFLCYSVSSLFNLQRVGAANSPSRMCNLLSGTQMLLWGHSFIRAIPCITETTFKYQILPIRFPSSVCGGVHSTVFKTGQGDGSRQTDGTQEKVWIWFR